MPRTYNSQQTIDKILTAAGQLFLQKGFDKTSMIEIAKAADVSKGAIYHHFTSKEEIMDAVAQHQSQFKETLLKQWLADMTAMTGREKIAALLEKSLSVHETNHFETIIEAQMKSPEFVLSYMQELVQQDSTIIAGLIREGIADGSLQTDYPDEAAEVLLLLLNIWCDPFLFSASASKLETRLKFFQQTMKAMGLDVLSDDLLTATLQVLKRLYRNGKGGDRASEDRVIDDGTSEDEASNDV